MDAKVLRTFRIPSDGYDADTVLSIEETDASNLVFLTITQADVHDDGEPDETETSIALTRDQFDALMNLRYDVRFVVPEPADEECPF